MSEDVLTFVGVGLVGLGLWHWVDWPAALVVVGGLLFVVGLSGAILGGR